MKPRNHILLSVSLLIGCLAVARIAQAATTVFIPTIGDWNNASNWSDGAFPSTADNAVINGGNVAEVNSIVGTTAGQIVVSNGTSLTDFAGLDINPGGDLTYEGELRLGINGGNGLVRLQGGNLSNVDQGATRTVLRGNNSGSSTFEITSGTFTAQGSAPGNGIVLEDINLDIYGGTIDISGGQVQTLSTPSINVFGDAATITMDRLNSGQPSNAATYNFEFNNTGVSSIHSNQWMDLTSATVNVNGSAYNGPSGTYNLFSSSNLAGTHPTPHLARSFPAGYSASFNVVNNNLVLDVIAPPAAPPTAAETVLNVFPASSQATLGTGNWNYTQTNNTDLSGSVWEPFLDENDVYHAALKHDQLVGTASQDWEIRIGKGGQIYSIRSDVGEIIPPQVQGTPGNAPWNDEVFQIVSVDSIGNSFGNKYYYHQSGYYTDGNNITEPTYSPLLASHAGNNEYSTLTLAVQASTTAAQQPAGVLNWQRTKDLGNGVVEVTQTIYNYGNFTVEFYNVPWGGVRESVFDHMLLSNPSGGYTDVPVNNWGDQDLVNIDTTGGWIAFSEGANTDDRAMALVIGNDDTHLSESWQRLPSEWRWGNTGVERDFFVGTMRRHINLEPGSGYYSRYYMVFGEVGDIESIINAEDLASDATYDLINFTEGNVDLLSWRINDTNGDLSVEQTTAEYSHFKTYGQPVENSKPLFLFEDSQGNEFISIDPYALSFFPYDGQTTYKGILGFVLPEVEATGTGPYVDLASLFPSGSNYYSDGNIFSIEYAIAGEVVQGFEADFNGDGVVDASDLSVWKSAYGFGPGADANADGFTNGADFLIWQEQFGNSMFTNAVSASTAQTIPEPWGIMLTLGVFSNLIFLRS